MEFRILGSLEVLDAEGRAVGPRGKRARTLLAVLLLRANETVTVDRLVEGIWGEQAPPTAAKIVQNLISQLRKTLGDRLETHGQGYRLRVAPEELDLTRFRRLVQDAARSRAEGDSAAAAAQLAAALSLWRGPALADIDWERRAADAEWLEELRLSAAEDRLAAELELGQGGGLVAEIEQLIAEQPLRERPRGQLMLALYRAGRQAEALAAYSEARSMLVETLGLEPSEELQQLQQAILRHDPSLEPPPPAATAGTVADPRLHRRRRTPTMAVSIGTGIGLVLAALAAALAVLARGHGAPAPVAPNSVAVVDPRNGRVLAATRVGARPVAIAVGAASAWIANAGDGTLSRIDLKTRKVVATIGIGGPVADIAVGLRSVWVVTGSEGHLVELDPRTNAVTRSYDLSGRNKLLPAGAHSVATADGFVWVGSDTAGGSLLRLTPSTGRFRLVLRRHFPPATIEPSAGAVWTTFPEGGTVQVDPRTGAITNNLDSPSNSVSLAVGGGSVWVGQLNGPVWQFAPGTATVTRTIPITGSPLGIAAGAGRIWVTGGDSGTLSEIDPQSGSVIRTLKLGSEPLDVAYGGGLIWVTVATTTSAG